MADNNLQRWISRLKNNPWPAHLPQIEVEKNASSIDSLVKCLSRDPLLASWVFKHAGHMFYQASNLRDAVTFLGIPKTLEACRHVPRIDVTAHKYNGLMQAVGDSLLAAELMQRWFNQRNFKWQDKDYWTVLYDSVIIWAMWWTEPTLMEGFDFRRINGDRLHTLICDYLDCRYLQILEAVNKEWHLPISFNLREQAIAKGDVSKDIRVSVFMLNHYFKLGYDEIFSKYWKGERHKVEWKGLNKRVDISDVVLKE